MNCVLRLAQSAELNEIMKIYRDARSYEGCVWDEYYPNGEILLEDFNANSLFAYVCEDEIVGAISVCRDEELEGFDCWRVNDGAHISFARVVIAKKYLGQGYGKKMVDALIKRLEEKRYSSVRILVSVENKAAMSIYRRLGFEFYFITEAYGEKFWVCEKVLTV